MRKLITLIAIIVIASTLLVVPSSAHSNYDGWPGGEGNFGTWQQPGGGPFKMNADDTLTDGHCVYMKANYKGSNTWYHTPWSCGAETWSNWITRIGAWDVYICVTGHWDCDYWATRYVAWNWG